MRYLFDAYTLDMQHYALYHQNLPMPCERRAFRLLVYLVQQRDRVVTRQELFDHLWPDAFVSDAALERCVATARRAVGDTGRMQGIIQTRHGVGYRFVADVVEQPVEAPGDVAPPPNPTTALPSQSRLEHSGVPTGERKLVTVLSGALAHPLAVAERLGLEVFQRLRQALFTLVQDSAQPYDGIFQPYGDDGFLVLFGIPVAQEDHAWRAMLVARELQQRLLGLHGDVENLQDFDLALGLGLHTGLIVVGQRADDTAQTAMVTGETAALAIRLQELAAPGALLASATTQRLLPPQVPSDVFGVVRLNGQADPIMAYTLLESIPQEPSIASLAATLGRPFVGRVQEVAMLDLLLTQMESGQGQVVGLVGDPGIGKSRCLAEFDQRVHHRPITWFAGHCLSYTRTHPYAPLRQIVRQHCGITGDDDLEAAIEKVDQTLRLLGMSPETDGPPLRRLLEIVPGTELLAQLTPQAVQEQIFDALCQMSLAGSQRQPLVLVVENLHWIDPTSEAYLNALVEELAGASILLLTTYRPGYHPPWSGKSYATQIALSHLTARDSLSIVRATAAPRPLPDTVEQDILARAEGNPLFLEELTQVVLEQGDTVARTTVPETIQGVLSARIDSLPETTRRVLQTASVLGREAPAPLLDQLVDTSDDLMFHLQALKRHELLYEQTGAVPVYVFKHALIQEAAYASLLLIQRQLLHAATAQALEVLYASRLEDVEDQLAYHYAQTDHADKAVFYLTRVADKAIRGHAHTEAVAVLQQALEHVERLPAEARNRRCIELVLRQANSNFRLGRFQESIELLLQEQGHLEQLQDPVLAGPYYFQIGSVYIRLGENQLATQHTQNALEAARQCSDDATMGKAYYALAQMCISTGNHRQGIDYSKQAIALLEPTAEQSWLGMAYTTLGSHYSLQSQFKQALAAEHQALAIGKAIGDRRLQTSAANLICNCNAVLGNHEAAIEAGQLALTTAPDPLLRALASAFVGHAYVLQRDVSQAIPLLERAIDQLGQFQARHNLGRCYTWLGQAFIERGELDQAADLARQGLAINQDISYPFGIAEAQWVLARIALRQDRLAEAEHHLLEAHQIFTARRHAGSLAGVHRDLAVLAHAQGNPDATLTHLREAYTRFSALQRPKRVREAVQLARKFNIALTDLRHPGHIPESPPSL